MQDILLEALAVCDRAVISDFGLSCIGLGNDGAVGEAVKFLYEEGHVLAVQRAVSTDSGHIQSSS